jgi:hypothetical protein
LHQTAHTSKEKGPPMFSFSCPIDIVGCGRTSASGSLKTAGKVQGDGPASPSSHSAMPITPPPCKLVEPDGGRRSGRGWLVPLPSSFSCEARTAKPPSGAPSLPR